MFFGYFQHQRTVNLLKACWAVKNMKSQNSEYQTGNIRVVSELDSISWSRNISWTEELFFLGMKPLEVYFKEKKRKNSAVYVKYDESFLEIGCVWYNWKNWSPIIW